MFPCGVRRFAEGAARGRFKNEVQKAQWCGSRGSGWYLELSLKGLGVLRGCSW